MKPLPITAWSVVNALGIGAAATLAALRARRSGLTENDFAPAAGGGFIGRVAGVAGHHLPGAFARFTCRNNLLLDLALRADRFDAQVAAAARRVGPARIGVVLGTSTSGITAGEAAFRQRDPASGALPADFDFAHTQDFFSAARFVRAALGLAGPAFVVSTACASAARSFVDAAQLIAAGVIDAAVVGGADSLCHMTLAGFAALGLISPFPCRPCDAARAGLSIGEAAGLALLERDGEAPFALLGYGESSDGYHMSAPHPEARGAIAAMRDALARASLVPAAIDYINLHGTGTPANDASEDRAVFEIFADQTPCSSTKGFTGHTLGASGIVEAVIALLALHEGFLPGCLGVTRLDPGFRARVLLDNESRPIGRVLSNSFGFGGANCSLIFGRAG